MKDAVTLTVTHIERMIPFTTCAFYLRRNDDSAAAAYVFGQNAERMRGASLAPGRGIVGWIIINGQPMHNTDPMLDLNDFLRDNGTGYRAAAVYPLNDGDKTIGALAVYSNELDAFGSNHLHLLESMARFASTSLHHAILYEQTRVNAQVDAPTGMPNGRALYEHAEKELIRAQEEGTALHVLSLNITGMRLVNYACGYQAGDKLPAVVAARPNQHARKHIELLADPPELHSAPSLRSHERESDLVAVNS